MTDASTPRPAWRPPSPRSRRADESDERPAPRSVTQAEDRLESVEPPKKRPPATAAHAPDAPSAPPAAGGPPPLRRRPKEAVIAGVCTGLGRSFGVDPVILRVAFVLLALAGGSGILLYLILAAVMPKERPGEMVPPPDPSRLGALRRVTGWAFIVLGGVLLIGRFVPGVEQVVWPVALLAMGAAVLVQSARS